MEGASVSSRACFLFLLCSVPGSWGKHLIIYRSVVCIRILLIITHFVKATHFGFDSWLPVWKAVAVKVQYCRL